MVYSAGAAPAFNFCSLAAGKIPNMIKAKELLNTDFKVGVLGGGQLGKMLALAAGNWHLPLHFLDKDDSVPAYPFASGFLAGSFADQQEVLDFGRRMDLLTIEIEHVNTDALRQLQREGITVHPAPAQLETIKDKGLQKQFYQRQELPTSPFQLFAGKAAILEAIKAAQLHFPFVQKSRTAGYDGKGVAVIRNEADLEKVMDSPSMVEDLVDIKKELAVVVARNERGEVKAFPTVEMQFNEEANLVELLRCPADIHPRTDREAQDLAVQVMEAYGICGLLAVELFLDQEDKLLINEVAPRPHNSGHHTIDSSYTSQFEQHLRGILNLPLGDTGLKVPAAVMINLLGAPGHRGATRYQGLDTVMGMKGVHVHLYGKTETRPFRKMGHATVVADDMDQAIATARSMQRALQIVADKQ